MNRRTFLKGMAAVAVLSVIPIQLQGQGKAAPIVALAGKKFYHMREGERLIGQHFENTVIVVNSHCVIHECVAVGGSSIIVANNAHYWEITNNFIDSGGESEAFIDFSRRGGSAITVAGGSYFSHGVIDNNGYSLRGLLEGGGNA